MLSVIEIDKIIAQNLLLDRERIEIDESLISLAKSIKANGLIQPITVRKAGDDKFRVVCGQRRIAAHKLIGAKTILAIVKDFDNIEDELVSIIDENKERVNLNPYDKYIYECKLVYLYHLKKKQTIDESIFSDDNRLLLNAIEYIKLIGRERLIQRDNPETSSVLTEFIRNCEMLNISWSSLERYSFIVSTKDEIIDLLREERVAFRSCAHIHKARELSCFPEIIEKIRQRKKCSENEVKQIIRDAKKGILVKTTQKQALIALLKTVGENDKVINEEIKQFISRINKIQEERRAAVELEKKEKEKLKKAVKQNINEGEIANENQNNI